MAASDKRLNNEQVEELADALELYAKPGQAVSHSLYQMEHDAKRNLSMLTCDALPREGLTTTVTFGFAHEDWTHANFHHRIELVQARDDPSSEYQLLLLAVAEGCLAARRLPKPGMIFFEAVVSARLPALAQRMPHATVIFPYSWELPAFDSVELTGGLKVWFLQVVPLYDIEMKYIQLHGFAAFEQLLVDQGAHFHKLDRESYVVKL